jgi:ZIP family zinc transporter
MRWDLLLILMIIPWVATFIGSYSALVVKINSNRRQGALLGFASGVMIAASIWSLIIPAFDEAGHTLSGGLIVTVGFVLGCVGMLILHKVVPHQHNEQQITEGPTSHLSRPMLLVMAVALHNIPEGIALGVLISSALFNTGMGWTSALVFSLGLAIQNYPEGFAVIFPLYQSGVSKKRCAWLGFLASLAEPIAAILGLVMASLLTSLSGVIMPLLLAIAAGAMIFIVVEELIPESQAVGSNHFATYGFLIGFWVMALMGILGT